MRNQRETFIPSKLNYILSLLHLTKNLKPKLIIEFDVNFLKE
ncbi:unnamed protein product [marine sediment metagenome]|uniref:Uncharacterized protein n=1 Tax=marine sediment metagenome TaxID=412755 RepID=X1G678_9ZZZZ